MKNRLGHIKETTRGSICIFACICIALMASSACGRDPLKLALYDDKISGYLYALLAGRLSVTGTSPADGETNVSTSTAVSVTFSAVMDAGTVTASTSDTACSGGLQVSADDFATCVRMSGAPIASNGDRTFTVTPFTGLGQCTRYRIRITTAVRDASGNSLQEQYTQAAGFNTQEIAGWTEDAGNPIYGGPLDGSTRAYYPCALKTGSTYHLWYGDGTNTRHATGFYPDFNDAVFPAPVVTGLVAGGPYHPRVLYNASGWDIGSPPVHYAGPFLMYYTDGANWSNAPRIAHSADGSSWTDIGPCTGINAYGGNTTVYNLSVLHEGGTIWKGYADNGLGHIQYYTSSNGIDWSGQAMDIMGGTYQAWESAAQGNIAPFIIKVGSTYVLFYSSGLTRNDNALGSGTSVDGQTFTKSTSNPIFSINDGVAWRDNRTYTTSIVQDGNIWLLYFTGRTGAGVYSVGFARKCGSLF